jgi:hypothetical protein
MASQTSYIQELRTMYSNKRIALLPDYGAEVKGVGLDEVAKELYGTGQIEV